MSLLTSIVDLECIQVDPSKGGFDPGSKSTEIEAVAHSIAKLEGLVRIPVVKSRGIDEYELVDGYLEYYAYKAARELNPNLPDRLTVFVMKTSNEKAILEQLEVDRQIAQIKQPSKSTKTQNETDEKLVLRVGNLESRIDSGLKDFSAELQNLKSELMTLVDSKLPTPLPLLEAFNRVDNPIIRKQVFDRIRFFKREKEATKIVEILEKHIKKGEKFEKFADVLRVIKENSPPKRGLLSSEKLLKIIDK